jgi:BirA family transcriptional regulator, biotin operon repressor / biotin---[acetyl-CoA-carboxylase] ligase
LIRTIDETGSTNSDLMALTRQDADGQGAEEGLWLRAERQSGGKGRQGRRWESPPGNLYASTLVRLRPGDPPAPTLALVAAVALHEAVAHFADCVRIKWPNDLIAGDCKLAGILLEREGDWVVIGFGVNVARHPDLTDRPATSLALLTTRAPEPPVLLEMLSEAFARWVGRWRTHGTEPVARAWLERSHPLGTPLATPGGVGLFDGLEPDGALRLRLADGTLRVVNAGDVFLI